MRIGLKEVLNIVSTKTGIDKRYITFEALFDPTDVDLGKGSSKSNAKWVCIEEFYKYPSQRGLIINMQKDMRYLDFLHKILSLILIIFMI